VALPPGPRAPAAWQTWAWVARPTDLLRRAQAVHGEPFTLRTAWADAPLVVFSDPEEIRRTFAAPETELRGGASAAFLEPFAGPTSILVTHGADHLRQRRLMLPPFHGAALRRWQASIAELARAEVAAWEAGRPLRSHDRMHALTLDVIARVVLGAGDDPALRASIRATLDMTTSLPRLAAMALVQRPLGGLSPFAAFLRAVRRVDERLHALIEGPVDPDSVLATLRSARHEDGSAPSAGELRDQLVTLLAAGHETTAAALAWALERLARHPAALARLRGDRDGDGSTGADADAVLDATVKEVLRVRPVLTVAPRQAVVPYRLGGYELPAGTHVAPSIYLVHRRPELWPDPTAFRPERFLAGGAFEPLSWIPFGGGTRRCVGAAFAALEMREVLRAVAERVALEPDRAGGERMLRKGVTLAPSRGGTVIPQPLPSPSARCRPSAATTA
jgi:cytochrome P450